jgi:hypothetical protein
MMRALKWFGVSLFTLLLVLVVMRQNREIQTDIWIDRPPADVWQILTATSDYPTWNPFIRSLKGDLRQGGKLEVEIAPPGGTPMTFRPTILVLQPNQELRWLGSVGIRGLFDGEHTLRLEPDGARTHFIQSERFSGLLVNRFTSSLLDRTQLGFAAMNQALKQRAESHESILPRQSK